MQMEAIERNWVPMECMVCFNEAGILQNWYITCCEQKKPMRCLNCLSKGKIGVLAPSAITHHPNRN